MSLTEMSTRSLSGGKGRPPLKADNLIAISEPLSSENMEVSTSHSLKGLQGLVQVHFTFVIFRQSFRATDSNFGFSSFIVRLFKLIVTPLNSVHLFESLPTACNP